jgi:hypothetical protein
LGKPSQFLFLWEEFFKEKYFDGVEMIAFYPKKRLMNFIEVLKQKNIPVISFHSRTGGESRLNFSGKVIMTVVNRFILDHKELVENFSSFEFLFHAPYLEDKNVFDYLVFNRKKIKKIWVENHLDGIEGVKEVRNMVEKLNKKGVNSSGLVDIYHICSKLKPKEIVFNWKEIVDDISKLIDESISGIHLPIGSRLDDSIPIEFLSDSDLAYFSEKIIPKMSQLTIENQQKFPGLLYSFPASLKNKKKETKKIFKD